MRLDLRLKHIFLFSLAHLKEEVTTLIKYMQKKAINCKDK